MISCHMLIVVNGSMRYSQKSPVLEILHSAVFYPITPLAKSPFCSASEKTSLFIRPSDSHSPARKQKKVQQWSHRLLPTQSQGDLCKDDRDICFSHDVDLAPLQFRYWKINCQRFGQHWFRVCVYPHLLSCGHRLLHEGKTRWYRSRIRRVRAPAQFIAPENTSRCKKSTIFCLETN